MRFIPLLAAPFLLALLALAHNRETGEEPKKVTIQGVVRNPGGGPLGGVEVTVWVLGKQDSVASVTTEQADGSHKLVNLELSATYDIAYTHSRYQPTWLQHLATGKDQTISKVMYLRGEKMPAQAANEAIQSAEDIYMFALSLEKSARRPFLARFIRGDPGDLRNATLGVSSLSVVDANNDVARWLDLRRRDFLNRVQAIKLDGPGE